MNGADRKKLIRSTIRPREIGRKERGETYSFESALDKEKQKFPDERALRALAVIFNDVIPVTREVDTASINKLQRHAFVSCMTTLAMGSPNRIVAEQLMLTKQKLKSRPATLIENGQHRTKNVFWLDWFGV